MDMSPPDLDSRSIKVFKDALEIITDAKIPFLIGGGLAFQFYTGHPRSFNDIDIFCKAGDYPKILQLLQENGYDTTIQDEKWLAKAFKDSCQIDFLFSTPNNVQTVDDRWFEGGQTSTLFDMEVQFLGYEELLWSKMYVQDAHKFDGPDVYNLILKIGEKLNWKSLLGRMEADWEILFAVLLTFRFVFPSKRHIVPGWLMSELIERLQRQLELPIPHDNICRGPLLSRTNYNKVISDEGMLV